MKHLKIFLLLIPAVILIAGGITAIVLIPSFSDGDTTCGICLKKFLYADIRKRPLPLNNSEYMCGLCYSAVAEKIYDNCIYVLKCYPEDPIAQDIIIRSSLSESDPAVRMMKLIELCRLAGYKSTAAGSVLAYYKMCDAPVIMENMECVCIPPGDDGKERMEFRKDGKTILSVTAKVRRLCFITEIYASKADDFIRMIYEEYPVNSKIDCRIRLHDLHGNGDFRYLLIADYDIGSGSSHYMHIIDTRNGFKEIAQCECGEIMNFPYKNDGLVFTKTIMFLGYFGLNGSAEVKIYMRYAPDNKPGPVLERTKLSDEQITSIVTQLSEMHKNSPELDKNMAITFLYASMIETGNLKLARDLAARIGYSPEYIEQFHAGMIKKIRESKYRDIIEKLNDMDLSEK